MITLKDIKKIYLKNIPKRFRININKYIEDNYVQDVIRRALKYELTDGDNKEIFRRGSHDNKEFPDLYWLVFIYIHPLTIGQYILEESEKI